MTRELRVITPRELKARYPYQFAGPHLGLSFYRGWTPVFAELCADIDAQLGSNKRGFHWDQLKEKFGCARWYWDMERLLKPDEVAKVKICSSITEIDDQRQRLAYPRELALRQRIQTLLQQAEARMQTACIVCGDLAEVDRSTGHHLVLCPEHARQRRRGDMEPAWFTDEEDRNGEGAP